jgi:hypothetical protein
VLPIGIVLGRGHEPETTSVAYFPDAVSQAMADGWRNGAAKAFERQNAAIARAALAQAMPVPA